MPIVRQVEYIRKSHLQSNRDKLYLFGDNHERYGLGGQAREMRYEPNAVGIRTKWRPARDPDCFFRDHQYDIIIPMIIEDLERPKEFLYNGGQVVIPFDGIGTGRASLKFHAPKVFQFLNDYLALLSRI